MNITDLFKEQEQKLQIENWIKPIIKENYLGDWKKLKDITLPNDRLIDILRFLRFVVENHKKHVKFLFMEISGCNGEEVNPNPTPENYNGYHHFIVEDGLLFYHIFIYLGS